MLLILNTILEKKFLKKKTVINVDNSLFYSLSNKNGTFIKKNDFFWEKKSEKIKFSRDIKRIRNKIFPILCKKLNLIHNLNFSKRSWNIIINPWLTNYLESMYYRWKQIKIIINKNKEIKTIFLKNVKPVIFFDNLEFNNNIYTSDYYNQFVLQRFWRYFKNKKIKIIIKNQKYKNNNLSYPFFKKKNIKNAFVTVLNKIATYIFKKQKYFIELNIGLLNYLKLCFNLKCFPTKGEYFFGDEMTLYFLNRIIKNNISIREKLNLFSKNSKNFMNFLNLFLKDDIPQAYVEKFNEIKEYVQAIPSNPKIIISDTLYRNTTLFKFWLAIKIESKKTKFICLDHGGLLGNGLRSLKYENEVSDLYISWIKPKKKVRHLPVLHLNKFEYKSPKQINKILFITHDGPKYPKYFNSGPISDEFVVQNELNRKFFLSLKQDLFKNILVRNYPHKNLSWWIKKKTNYLFSKEQIVTNTFLYKTLLKDAKLKICNYPKTAFLQSLKCGPTILFYKKNFYLDTNSNQKILEHLKEAKIFFDNPTSCANHINKNWHNIEEWWNLNKTQKAINLVNEIFCYTNKNAINEWSQFLKKTKI